MHSNACQQLAYLDQQELICYNRYGMMIRQSGTRAGVIDFGFHPADSSGY